MFVLGQSEPTPKRMRGARMSAAFLTSPALTTHRLSTGSVRLASLRPSFARPPPRRAARIHANPCAVLPTLPALSAGLLASAGQAASTGTGIAILGAIIFFHECGHYFAARWQGIRVKNFSVGFGPTVFSFVPKGSETEFTLRALPLGGYVAFEESIEIDEETGEERVNEDPDLLQNRAGPRYRDLSRRGREHHPCLGQHIHLRVRSRSSEVRHVTGRHDNGSCG
jgi:Peptidase family M50